MIKVKPISVNHLFPELHQKLVKLFKTLEEREWYTRTACSKWCVKDIAQHLLEDYLGVLSRKRDNYKNPTINEAKFKSNIELVDYINKINKDWVDVTKTLSPILLIQLLEFSGDLLFKHHSSVNLMKAESKVSWISTDKLPNWMDIAREYTEHWLHQNHIREAVNKPLLTSTHLFHPFIQTYMLALPKTYKDINTKEGTSINIKVKGNAGGDWSLVRMKNEWVLYEKQINNAQTIININQDTLWRLFSKGINKNLARKRITIKGNKKLGENILNTISLIA